jgi:ZIP family zinc transporter
VTRRRIWVVGVPLVIAAVASLTAIARPWHGGPAASDDVRVEQAVLRPGRIVLVLVNGSRDVARVAQVILNDAFVDFHQSQRSVEPGKADRIIVSFPWIHGESYDLELMTSTGATVAYEIEDAEAGLQTA